MTTATMYGRDESNERRERQEPERRDGLASRWMTRARLTIVGAAGLLAAAIGLEFWAGVPPTDGDGLLAWMDSNRTALILLDEVLVFAGVVLVGASLAVKQAVTPTLGERLTVAHWFTVMTGTMLFVTALVGGRFVYPVHEIMVEDGDAAALVAGLFYGGLHIVWLLLAATVIAVAVAVRPLGGRSFTAASLLVAVAAIVASYPDRLGPEVAVAVRLPLVCWLLLLAAKLPATERRSPAPRLQPAPARA